MCILKQILLGTGQEGQSECWSCFPQAWRNYFTHHHIVHWAQTKTNQVWSHVYDPGSPAKTEAEESTVQG